ncbi:MAG TPA: energy transducer TonB [Pyrinomonadaceae bacterium]|jgi:hypothetical protein
MDVKLFSVLILLFGTTFVFSQNPAPVLTDNTSGKREETAQVGEVRGTIKRKAVFLPKPPFPREALEAGADGAVRVEVTLNAAGEIVAAKAVSGHPLLFRTAEETARKSRFRSVETADPNLLETGVIVYNFSIEKMSWLRIGYDLAAIQKAPTLRGLNVGRIVKTFAPEWSEEHEMLAKLAEMRRVEVESGGGYDSQTILVRKISPNGTLRPSLKAEMLVKAPKLNPPTPERIALAQNLAASLMSRLAGDEANSWRFNAGVDLLKALETARNPNDNRNAAEILRRSLDGAPAAIPAETLGALGKLIEIFESGNRTVDSRTEISRQLGIVFADK